MQKNKLKMSQWWSTTIITLIFVMKQIAAQEIFNFRLTCDNLSFKNWALFSCRQCGANQVVDPNNTGCQCQDDAYWAVKNLPSYDCILCAANEVSFPNKTACTGSSVTSCGLGEHLNYFQPAGSLVAPVDCQVCDVTSGTSFVDNEFGEKCFPCQSGSTRTVGEDQCKCAEKNVGGLCLT